MRPIRVLQITHDLHPGGLPRVVETLCRTMDTEAFRVSVLCLRDRGALAEGLSRDLEIPIHLLHDRPDVVDRTAFLKVARLLRKHPVDVIHTHNSEPFFDGTLGAVLAGVRTVVHTEHGRDWAATPLRWRLTEGALARYAYRVVGVSDEATRSLARYEWIPREKLVTIPNGIDGDRYDAPVDRRAKRAELALADDALVVGYASRLEEEKDCALLVRAFAEMAASEPRAVLVVAGYGSERPRLEALARDLGIADRTRFLGVRMDVPELLKIYDVHALSSRREGLPMVLLEAMAAGCPTVATAVGGIPAALDHGRNGELVPAGDVRGMAGALGRLLADPVLRDRYAQRARRAFRHRYEARVMTERYQRLYRRESEEGVRPGRRGRDPGAPGTPAPGGG
ncbi:MAG: glycosyltransferase [Longimicrobiales bacterium]|nr:glycosyltransferase [Longimicrobiales bacterium]